MSLLELENISVHYGRIEALSDISIRVEQGEIVTLIGANGAGKTTTMKAISGCFP
jgi:branched-chain amino acid transport system ATP-binding protein